MKLFSIITRMAGVAACLSALAACATPSQMYWDAKVKDMCEKDGGVTVYEKVKITKHEFSNLKIPTRKNSDKSNDYYFSFEDTIINDDPKVRKSIGYLHRNHDNKIIAKQVYYSRMGGDFELGIGHPTSFSCDGAGINTNIMKSVFVIIGD